jgi:hypothetical protein
MPGFVRSMIVGALLSISLVGSVAAAPSPPPAGATTRENPEELGPPPENRLVLNNLLVGRYNPLGLEDQIRFGFQRRLFASYKPAFRDNFLFVGIYPKINPAFIKIGPMVEVQPLSILNLRFQAEMIDYFGTFGELQSFTSPLAIYSDSALTCNDKGNDDNACQGLPPGYGTPAMKNYVTHGMHFVFEPMLQMKFGPIAIRNRFSIEYWNMRLRPGDTVFYEITLDTLIPASGWVLANDLDVLYITKFRFVAGLRYSVVHPFYSASDYQPGQDTSQNPNGHQRIGPLLAYTFFEKGYARFDRPSLILIANWYVQHRWRTGQDVNQGIPYVVLAFAFQSDLMK